MRSKYSAESQGKVGTEVLAVSLCTVIFAFSAVILNLDVLRVITALFAVMSMILLIVKGRFLNRPATETENPARGDSLEELPEEGKMAYIGTVAAGLAHEIRNPLNAIDFNIRMIQEDLESGEKWDETDIRERFDSTYREIKHLERLVSDFLLYARKTVLQIDKTDAGELLESVKAFLADEASRKGCHIEVDIKDCKYDISADREVLRQALFNIAKNGIDAMEAGGILSLSCGLKQEMKMVEIRIADTGLGIHSRELRKIFHLFYTTRRSGTGLGLPVAKSIVENHKGWMEVNSSPGKGSTFHIFLPLFKEEGDLP